MSHIYALLSANTTKYARKTNLSRPTPKLLNQNKKRGIMLTIIILGTLAHLGFNRPPRCNDFIRQGRIWNGTNLGQGIDPVMLKDCDIG